MVLSSLAAIMPLLREKSTYPGCSDFRNHLSTRIAALPDIGADLEKKVVLSIAIRLAAEEFAIAKIDDDEWVTGLNSNQTAKLINRYKEKFASVQGERSNIRLLEQVNLMTPENIHLNSFMFEPILDMSAEHLARLHTEIMQLEA